jgi:hypothetical protein
MLSDCAVDALLYPHLPQPEVDLVTKKGLAVFLAYPHYHPRPPSPTAHVLRVCFLNNHLPSYFILLFRTLSRRMSETVPNFGLSAGRSTDTVLFI